MNSLNSTPSTGVFNHAVTRRAALQIGGLAGFAVLMSACAPTGRPAPTPAATPVAGGSVTWAINGDPVTLAPFGVTGLSSQYAKNLIYESLVTWDPDLNVLPALAESWEVPDESTYIFKLRSGVLFHDGRELTADDVKYSFDLQQTPPPPGSINSNYPKVASIEVIDPLTVRFNMSQADGTVLGYCAWLAYSFVCPEGMYDEIDPNNQAIGTGPFKLVAFTPNDNVELARHEDYWQDGLPYLDSVTLKVLTEMQSVVTAVGSGSIDGAFIDADSALGFTGNPNVQIQTKPSVAFRELEWTIRSPDVPWADVRVRQAINYAIDREKIIANVYAGEAEYSSKIPPSYGNWALPDEDLRTKWQVFDVARAKELMAEAGYEDGFSVVAQALAAPNDYVKIAQIVAEQLKEINIAVEVQPLEIGVFGPNNASGNFEWQFTGRGMRGDPSGYFTDFDPGRSVYQAWFEGGYSNDELTELFFKGVEETDPDARHEIYNQMQEIVLDELPTVPLVAPMQFQAVRSHVQGMTIDIAGTMRYLPEAWVTE